MVCGMHGVPTHHAVHHAEVVTELDIANAGIRNLVEGTAKAHTQRRLVATLTIAQV